MSITLIDIMIFSLLHVISKIYKAHAVILKALLAEVPVDVLVGVDGLIQEHLEPSEEIVLQLGELLQHRVRFSNHLRVFLLHERLLLLIDFFLLLFIALNYRL
jgi:hypothetical protein